MAFRKDVWKKFKFRNVLDEDIDFGLRIFKNGWKGYFVSNAKVKARIAHSFSDLRYQQLRWYQSFLESKVFLFLFVFSFFFPSLGLVTLIYLIFIKSVLAMFLFILNIILFTFFYIVFSLNTPTKNFVNELHLLVLNPLYFLFLIENIIRNLLKFRIKWLDYKY